MPSCFVPTCKSGYPKQIKYNAVHNIRNPSLFKPQTEDMCLKWERAINRADIRLRLNHVVCELHFAKEDIELEYRTQMPDGSVCIIKRDRAKLKSDVIPTIFPNYPKYLEKVIVKKRKAPTERSLEAPCKSRKRVNKQIEISDSLLTNELETNLISVNKDFKLPQGNWTKCRVGTAICFICFDEDLSEIIRRVVLYENKTIRIFIAEKEISVVDIVSIQCYEEIENILRKVNNMFFCTGSTDTERSINCIRFVEVDNIINKPFTLRCSLCKKHRQFLNRRKRVVKINKVKHLTRRIRSVTNKNTRLQNKLLKLRKEIYGLMEKFSSYREDVIIQAVSKLPEIQMEAVLTCFKYAKLRSKNGMRYTTQWVYECLLLRIKSRKAYEHLRQHEILPLPCIQTLNRYIKNIKGAYGFHQNIFDALKLKLTSMTAQEKRGVILIDEIKLSKSVSLNQKTLEVQGFTNLGKYTPEHQKTLKGDHALVLMFQPFQGKWVQTLACFLSKGCASGSVLYHILIEAIILTERSGLYVDAIVSDGATWNRTMWDKFGVNLQTVGIEHVIDPVRKLWFISDFPHLIKNVRNFLIKHEETWTPDGIVKLQHWMSLLKIEENPYALKVNYKFSLDHIKPKYFQKMNVALAFQFFYVGESFQLFRNENGLKDSLSTQTFCQRVSQLIHAMNSRTPSSSLKLYNEHWHAIMNFLQYLNNWEVGTQNNYNFLSASTCYGLKISLNATLEMCDYLINTCGYKYLMTSRLNQDALERFFSLMRNVCGSNDNPDSNLFIQMYRLVSSYSLIKPIKGSNISGKETLESLLKSGDTEYFDASVDFKSNIKELVDKLGHTETLNTDLSMLEDHNGYIKRKITDYVITYISGYIYTKAVKFAKFKDQSSFEICDSCLKSMVLSGDITPPERHHLIEIRSKGALIHPSGTLFHLISILEDAIVGTITEHGLNLNTLLDIMEEMGTLHVLPLVGCSEHNKALTTSIISFYLIMRMHFVCKEENLNEEGKKITKEKRKASKL